MILVCAILYRGIAFLRFSKHTYVLYILYLTVIVLSYYISVKACRCQYVNRICLAHLYMYNYTTFIFFSCFLFVFASNSMLTLRVQRKTDYAQVKRLHLHIFSAPFGLFVTRDAYQTVFMLRLFCAFEKKK